MRRVAALVLAAAVSAPVALAVDATIVRPPNVIIYLVDDLGCVFPSFVAPSTQN